MEEQKPPTISSPPTVPATPVPPQSVTRPKTFLLVALGLVLMLGLLFAGVVLDQKGFLSGILPVRKSSPTTAPQPTPTPDPTESWKTYASADYKFSFLYPGSSTIEEVGQKGEWLQVVVDKGKKTSFSIRAMLKFEPNDPDFYLDNPSIGQKTVGENVWKLFSLPKGYGDGPGFSSPLFAWQVKKNSILYTVTFYNQSEISASQEEIISAFKLTQ